MPKAAFIFGTRPEAIKLAPLIKLFKSAEDIQTEICITGQHREMLQQVLTVFDIVADTNLDLMSHDQSLAGFTSRSLSSVDQYIKKSKPDYIFVQGDTSTVLAASLAAFYNKTKIFHVEAGLRTNDFYSPFPEEMNRRLTSQLAYFHFAPTERAKNNLLKDGIQSDRIAVTGNTAIDSLLLVKEMILSNKVVPLIPEAISTALNSYQKIVLITGHRRENFGNGFINICNAIAALSKIRSDCLFIYPVHLNPNVRTVVYDMLSGSHNILLIPPQSYVEFVYLMMRSDIILTDSGGVQEEAPSLKKPILVMRENTERPEGIAAGCSKLVGTSMEKITEEVNLLLSDNKYYNSFATSSNPYGDGNASKCILNETIKLLN